MDGRPVRGCGGLVGGVLGLRGMGCGAVVVAWLTGMWLGIACQCGVPRGTCWSPGAFLCW